MKHSLGFDSQCGERVGPPRDRFCIPAPIPRHTETAPQEEAKGQLEITCSSNRANLSHQLRSELQQMHTECDGSKA